MSPEARNQLLFIAVAVLLLFVLVIRPARKRAQHVSKLQSALSPGDEIMLTSGIFGTVLAIQDEAGRLQVQVTDGVVLTVHRGAVAEIVKDVPASSEQAEQTGKADDGTPEATAPDNDATSSNDAGPRGAN